MTPRSWLFVPGDSPKKIQKAAGAGADALILDLEDSVALARKPAARAIVAGVLRARPSGMRYRLRINRIHPVNTAASGLPDLRVSTRLF